MNATYVIVESTKPRVILTDPPKASIDQSALAAALGADVGRELRLRPIESERNV